MKAGVHANQLAQSLSAADEVYILVPPELPWSVAEKVPHAHCLSSVDDILRQLGGTLQAQDQVLIMSNGGFENIHQRLLNQLHD